MLNAIVDLFDKNVRLIIDRQIKDKNITERNDIFNILNEHNFKLNERMEESFRIAQEKESQTDIKINQFIQDNYNKK